MMEEKIFFTAGDVVTLRQNIPNVPIMIVKTVDKFTVKSDPKPMLIGITCAWFTTTGEIQEHRFNTKDLIHYVQNEV
jgi:uncharacterized protein YodC (DUF2158 family)